MSPDGTNWSEIDNMTATGFSGVAYGNNEFVAVTSGQALTSPDGITWPLPTGGGNVGPSGALVYGDGLFVGLLTGALAVTSSPDGVNWTPHNVFDYASLNITYANGSFWVLGDQGLIVECRVIPEVASIQLLSNGAPNITVSGVGGMTNSIQTSTDLKTWFTLTNVSLTNGIGQFVDLSTTNLLQRFYRAVAQ